MPIKKQDATRALELLEQYHKRLSAPEDAQLRSAIERVIKIFKSKLFNALIEIQEFYEVTLLDENKSIEQKALETHKVAEKWADASTVGLPPSHQPGAAKVPKAQKSASHKQDDAALLQSNAPAAAAAAAAAAIPETEPGPEGGAFELVLHRAGQGFGFSIAGGTDEHHVPGDTRIFVTKVVPGGIAAADGRMRVNDAILAVNGVDVTAVSHEAAVTSLKLSGNQLRLLILRQPTSADNAAATVGPDVADHHGDIGDKRRVEVTLVKTTKGLGFSIAGGVDNQHLPGDDAIFVTKIIDSGAAHTDGRMAFGDRLLAVDGRPLHGFTHQEAVAALKATGERVRLTVAKATPAELQTLYELEEAARLMDEEEAEAAAAYQGAPPADGRHGRRQESGQDAYYAGNEELQGDDKSKRAKGLGGIFGKKKK